MRNSKNFVNSFDATLLDLVCNRYPNIKPSDYLEIKDSLLAFELDSALAFKGRSEEFKELAQYLDAVARRIEDSIDLMVMVWTGKKVERNRIKPKAQNNEEELPPLSKVLKDLGASNVPVKYKKGN